MSRIEKELNQPLRLEQGVWYEKKKDLKQDERQSVVQTTNNIRERGAMGLSGL